MNKREHKEEQAPWVPAVRRLANVRPTLLAFEIAGKISKSDIEHMARQVEESFDAFERIDMLLIMSDFEGMEADAVFDPKSLRAQFRSIRHVRKYGVVGAPAFARVLIELSDFISPVETKTFDLPEQAEAWAWIKA